MQFTIANLKDDLTGMMHGGSANKIKNFYSLCSRAGRNVLSRIDPLGTRRTAIISNAIHSDIYRYTAPVDLKGKKIIDMRPQMNRGVSDHFSGRSAVEFDMRKSLESGKTKFHVSMDTGDKILWISKAINPEPTKIHDMDSLTADGAWTAGGQASNLTVDTLNYVSGSGALRFDIGTAGTDAYLENTTLGGIDLSSSEDEGEIFARVYIPDTTNLSQMYFRMGDDLTTNYWDMTTNSPHDRTTWRVGWQIVRFSWSGATQTGTPASSSINALKIGFTFSGALTTAIAGFRVDRISCSKGKIYELDYYSEYLFKTSAGVWQASTTSDDDIVNLDGDAYQIYVTEVGILAAHQMQGEDSSFDITFLQNELYGNADRLGLYKEYAKKYPSEAIKEQDTYYRIRK